MPQIIIHFSNRQEQDQSPSTSSSEERQSEGSACVTSLYSHLTTLRNLRDGFIEQHGSEPSVSLRYSQQSTANATISLRVGDEYNRGNFDSSQNDTSPVPSTSQSERVFVQSSSELPDDGAVNKTKLN